MKRIFLLFMSLSILTVFAGCGQSKNLDMKEVVDLTQKKEGNRINKKDDTSVNVSKEELETDESEIQNEKFGEEEIKQFLIEAESWIADFDHSLIKNKEKPGSIIGIKDGRIIEKISDNIDIESSAWMKKLEKYYSEQVALGEMERLLLNKVGNKYGVSRGVSGGEIYVISEKSPIEVVLDEEDRKVVKVGKAHIDHQEDEAWETEYELLKNRNGQWKIFFEEGYMGEGRDIKKRIYPKFTEIETSTFLEGYNPEFIIDDNYSTAYVEGIQGDGIGEWVELKFDKEYEISSFIIMNGYQKNEDIFEKNNRVKKVLLEFSNGESKVVELEDSMYNRAKNLEKAIKTKGIKITILEVYPGNKYDDTCITEVMFFQ